MGLEATVQEGIEPQKPVQGPIGAGQADSRAPTNKASSIKAVSLENVLAEEVGGAIEAQERSQQKERQKDLSFVWDCVVKELELHGLRILEGRYEARIAGLAIREMNPKWRNVLKPANAPARAKAAQKTVTDYG
jgi:hypothetical protein